MNERTRRSGARARDDRRGRAGIDRGSRLVIRDENAGRQLQGHVEDRNHHAADGRCRLPRAGAALLDAVRDLDAREETRSQGAARPRRHAGREGSRRGSRRRPEDDRRLAARGSDRTGDVRCCRLGEQGVVRGGHRPHLAVRDADVVDAGLGEGGHAGVLPGRPGRLHPGPDRRELHGRQAEREEGRPDRLPGALLRRSRRCGRGRAQAEGCRRPSGSRPRSTRPTSRRS